jgi:hypothetical protein
MSGFVQIIEYLCDGPPRFYNLDIQDEWQL